MGKLELSRTRVLLDQAVLRPISWLRPFPNNPRKHSDAQVRALAKSIKGIGWARAIASDESGTILYGHGCCEAAKLLGLTEVPVTILKGLSAAQKRALVIADNRLAELAVWDNRLLAIELKELSLDLDFDVSVTGFEAAEIDLLIGALSEQSAEEADAVPEVDRTKPAVSREGDLWQIGEHRIYCGDALDRDNYRKLLPGRKADIIFTDPPYNVAIAGNVSGLGRNKHREFAMASGEMSPAEFTQFLQRSFENLSVFSTNGSIHFVCMDWRHMGETLDAARDAYHELKNLCVWTKTNGGMGSLYRSQHELVFVFKNGRAGHINNVELGRFGRNRSNVWAYAGANAFGKGRDSDLSMHPTTKPVAMVADALMDCSKRGAIVLDAFAGSGTTLVAAQRTGRKGYGIELDPHYVDTTIRRFDAIYGLKARHVATAKSFSSLEAERREEEEATSATVEEASDKRTKAARKVARRR
jgi:DNA modification methylase